MSTPTASAVAERTDQALPGWQSNPRVWIVSCPVHCGITISLMHPRWHEGEGVHADS